MTAEQIDIVSLINNNPLTKLSNDYRSKIISKIQERFGSEDQQLFVANFYCYLNYNSKTDFVIELDRIWKWLGYGRIEECKRVLVKNFKENIDYKVQIYFPQDAGKKPEPIEEPEKQEKTETRGRKPEYITLTINCFKKLCLKSRTEKADQIHDYYIGLEELINEVVAEQAVELQNRLQIKDNQKEQNLITNFNKKPILYVGFAEKNIVKSGYTNNIKERLTEHKHDIRPDFTFEYVYESVYNREIERRLYRHFILKQRRLSKVYPGRKEPQTELFLLDDNFTINDLDKIIREIKSQVESGEHDDLLNEIKELELENTQLKLQLNKKNSTKFDEIRNENNELKLQIEKLEHELKKQNNFIKETDAKIVDTQLNSMEDLNLKLHEIKKAVCYNFLVDLIAKEIISNTGKTKLELKLTIDEIFDRYKQFRISNRYQDPIYDEKYEKSIITKAFNEVDGIKNTFKTINGEQSRAKLFYVDKISEWILNTYKFQKDLEIYSEKYQKK